MDPNAVLERHPKFYIPSGDVVLAAKASPQADESRPTYQLFRVHKFLLGLRSTIFSHLFADADAAASNEPSYDGVPLVELHGDNAEDFALLLSCIYDPEMSLTFEHHDPDTPIAVSGVIRLADKYLLEPLRKRLVTQVADDWPTTLREWDIHQAEIKAITDAGFTRFDDPAERGPPLCDVIPEPASAIVFAQEFGCPEILPAAFYQLLQIHIKHDWSMQPVHKSAGPGPYPWCPLALARWGLLDKDNLARYVHGLHAAEDYVPDVLSFVSRGCIPGFHEGWESDPTSSCFLYVQNMLDVLGNRKGIRGARDPLRWLADCLHRDRFPEPSERHPRGLCEHCWSALSNQVPRERQRIWRELLPKWFQLE